MEAVISKIKVEVYGYDRMHVSMLVHIVFFNSRALFSRLEKTELYLRLEYKFTWVLS